MNNNEPIGHLTVRIPIFLERESESWEIPQEYTYLAAGEAELVSHDIPVDFHGHLRDELVESGGIEVGQWGEAELAATTTLPADTESTSFPYPRLLDLFNGR